MTWLTAVMLLMAAILIIVLATQRTDARRLKITHLRLFIPHLPEALHGMRAAFLSDLHASRTYVSQEHLLATVSEARPDLLLLGGDYAYGGQYHAETLELIQRLSAGLPAFGVRGNTDVRQQIDTEALGGILRAGGGALLMNEAARYAVNGSTVEILGIDDPLENDHAPARTLAQSDPEADLRVGLAHSPGLWQELAEFGAHICLCGHTHGGQVRVPRMEAPVTHRAYPRMLASGLFQLKDGEEPEVRCIRDHWRVLALRGRPLEVEAGGRSLLYVSRGVGVSWLPMRVFCPPEMVLLEFVCGELKEGESESA